MSAHLVHHCAVVYVIPSKYLGTTLEHDEKNYVTLKFHHYLDCVLGSSKDPLVLKYYLPITLTILLKNPWKLQTKQISFTFTQNIEDVYTFFFVRVLE